MRALYALIEGIQALLIVRCIMSWFMARGGNVFYQFLVSLTEPVLAPARWLLSRSSFSQNMPIDLSILVTFVLLNVIQRMLF